MGNEVITAPAATFDRLTMAKLRRYLPDDLRRPFVEMMENHVRLFLVRDEDFRADRPACRDPRDNQFQALALECEANAIVSSDEDLLVLDPWGEIRFLRPGGFLNELSGSYAACDLG